MKPQLTDAEFDVLKRERDAKLQKVIADICDKTGWDPREVHVHTSHGSGCYCACPDGPCQHKWDGPWWTDDDGRTGSATCSKCGALAFSHDMRCGM